MPGYFCSSIRPPWAAPFDPERDSWREPLKIFPSVPKSPPTAQTHDGPCDVPGCFVCAQATEPK
jgi:hypothetical protein